MLTDKIAYAVEEYIAGGSGTNEPKGIKYATTYTDTVNGVDFAGTHITYAELIELISYLPSRHARKAKFYMHRTTMWQELANIRDDGKYPVLKDEGAVKWSCMGYMIVLSDAFTTGEIYFGNAKMIVANLAEDVNVAASEHSGFNYNAIDYRGTAIFDCKCADEAAFVKGAASL
jgi:HK97 family phage major capsid protein